MWIICLADDSHEMSSLIFLEKYNIFRMSYAAILNFALRLLFQQQTYM